MPKSPIWTRASAFDLSTDGSNTYLKMPVLKYSVDMIAREIYVSGFAYD